MSKTNSIGKYEDLHRDPKKPALQLVVDKSTVASAKRRLREQQRQTVRRWEEEGRI